MILLNFMHLRYQIGIYHVYLLSCLKYKITGPTKQMIANDCKGLQRASKGRKGPRKPRKIIKGSSSIRRMLLLLLYTKYEQFFLYLILHGMVYEQATILSCLCIFGRVSQKFSWHNDFKMTVQGLFSCGKIHTKYSKGVGT